MQNNYNSETPMLNRTELEPSDKRDLLLKIISCKSVYKARDAVLNAINELTSEQTILKNTDTGVYLWTL
jgi:hypothetical protein